MAENIHAIETIYDGYRFRSRLEARWAVYFHESGIPYVYEQEGFVLSNRKYYLPDFYLPWFDSYVEIKPSYMNEEDEKVARNNLELMWASNACSKVMIFFGDPLDDEKELFCIKGHDNKHEWVRFEFLEGCWYDDDNYGTTKHWVSINVFGEPDEFYRASVRDEDLYPSMANVSSYRSNFDYAKQKARQARFEHGGE